MTQKLLLHSWILVALAVASFARTLSAEATDDGDKLTAAEENYVYGTKGPSQRVKAFLKIADGKVEQVKKDVRSGASADISVPFRGYSAAIEGAWMGVSWGQARRTDMTDSARTIQKTTKRHVAILQHLEARAPASQREALGQILSTILRIQNSESNSLYARK